MFEDLIRDFRHALRRLFRAPGFTTVAVLTLAVGIGATTALFSVVHGVLLRPLPYPEPERIVRVFEVMEDGTRPSGMSDPNFADLRRRNRSFANLAQYQSQRVSVAGGARPVRVVAAQVSEGFFQAMGVEPAVGRTFDARERREGAAPVGLVSHRFWRRHLGSDEDLSRHTLRYGDDRLPVIGVLPPGFHFPDDADLWIPRELEPVTPSRTALNKKTLGRLAADSTLDQARQDLAGIAQRLKRRHGDDTYMSGVAVEPLREVLVADRRGPLLLLLGAAIFLLIIACANVVNLLLARAASQQRELAVRVALGAGHGRILQVSLTESLVLAIAGGTLGALLARWGVGLLRSLELTDLPRMEAVRVDATVLLFSFAVAMAVALGLAAVAAWRVTRISVRGALAEGRRSEVGGGSRRLRGALIVSQVALTLVLLVGTGLLLRSFQGVLGVEPGYRTSGALLVSTSLPFPESDEEVERQSRFHRRLLDRLETLPGVSSVAAINAFPLTSAGAGGTFILLNRPDEVTDWESFGNLAKLPRRTGHAQFRSVTPGYFEAMGIPLVEGRGFQRTDLGESAHVAVVSESLARQTWPDESPLGQLVQFGNMDGDLRPFTIVGVVSDVRAGSLEAEPRATFYANALQRRRGLTGAMDLVVFTEADPEARIPAVRRAVGRVDATVAPTIRTLEELRAGLTAQRRFQILLLGVFAAAALLLAVIGVYGVISFHVARRHGEIGVRLALGAVRRDVMWRVLRRGLVLAGMGIALGWLGAFAVTRLMRSLLYEVTATDPVTFVAVPVVLLLAAAAACYLPARRATEVDPAVTLRAE